MVSILYPFAKRAGKKWSEPRRATTTSTALLGLA